MSWYGYPTACRWIKFQILGCRPVLWKLLQRVKRHGWFSLCLAFGSCPGNLPWQQIYMYCMTLRSAREQAWDSAHGYCESPTNEVTLPRSSWSLHIDLTCSISQTRYTYAVPEWMFHIWCHTRWVWDWQIWWFLVEIGGSGCCYFCPRCESVWCDHSNLRDVNEAADGPWCR